MAIAIVFHLILLFYLSRGTGFWIIFFFGFRFVVVLGQLDCGVVFMICLIVELG